MPRRRYDLKHAELDGQIDALVAHAQEVFGPSPAADQVRQIVVTALQLVRDGASPGDIKLLTNALKEMRHAARVFAPYEHIRKVAVFGSARTEPGTPDWEAAREFAEQIVRAGWMVITGAGDGIMGAAQGGAGRERSFGVNIRLPFEQSANATIKGDAKLINFRYFFTRKVSFVKESHAVVLFPGGYGTHDEGLETLTLVQTGKSEIVPIVFVDAPGGSYWRDWDTYIRTHLGDRGLISLNDLNLYTVTDDIEVAIAELTDFYRNYHSSRYVRDRLVLRVHIPPDAETLERLNVEFADILTGGRIECGPALPEESSNPDLVRVLLNFNRRDHGRLRLLIARLNALAPSVPVHPDDAAPHEIRPVTLSPEAEEAERDDDPAPGS